MFGYETWRGLKRISFSNELSLCDLIRRNKHPRELSYICSSNRHNSFLINESWPVLNIKSRNLISSNTEIDPIRSSKAKNFWNLSIYWNISSLPKRRFPNNVESTVNEEDVHVEKEQTQKSSVVNKKQFFWSAQSQNWTFPQKIMLTFVDFIFTFNKLSFCWISTQYALPLHIVTREDIHIE